jgi:beta-glucosidase
VTLQPGETAHVLITLDSRAFSYWDVVSHAWLASPHHIMIGSSSRDIRLTM